MPRSAGRAYLGVIPPRRTDNGNIAERSHISSGVFTQSRLRPTPASTSGNPAIYQEHPRDSAGGARDVRDRCLRHGLSRRAIVEE